MAIIFFNILLFSSLFNSLNLPYLSSLKINVNYLINFFDK
ncbi:hypothetical protein RICGR_0765 [Rickettsiella grylli]|uniref:Uncharacterized protein n=1 Tax=Rickettsiella grylli TaxID=59196 RepID=A8PML8_9COXI|nr:hypothetical protein RICGR_0765 [Rickettsiella grylli]